MDLSKRPITPPPFALPPSQWTGEYNHHAGLARPSATSCGGRVRLAEGVSGAGCRWRELSGRPRDDAVGVSALHVLVQGAWGRQRCEQWLCRVIAFQRSRVMVGKNPSSLGDPMKQLRSPTQAGHAGSMNMILSITKTRYLLYVEDDWWAVHDNPLPPPHSGIGNFMWRAMEVLTKSPERVAQVGGVVAPRVLRWPGLSKPFESNIFWLCMRTSGVSHRQTLGKMGAGSLTHCRHLELNISRDPEELSGRRRPGHLEVPPLAEFNETRFPITVQGIWGKHASFSWTPIPPVCSPRSSWTTSPRGTARGEIQPRARRRYRARRRVGRVLRQFHPRIKDTIDGKEVLQTTRPQKQATAAAMASTRAFERAKGALVGRWTVRAVAGKTRTGVRQMTRMLSPAKPPSSIGCTSSGCCLLCRASLTGPASRWIRPYGTSPGLTAATGEDTAASYSSTPRISGDAQSWWPAEA